MVVSWSNNNIYIIHIPLLIISFLISLYLLGFDNLNFLNKNWLYLGDLSQYQIGWEFFRNDSWKFPLGFNPNYGLEFGNSIVFTDSIPLLAFIFKLFKNFLPENFQYFSLWIVLSIYLQLLFSYLIIFNLTKNFYFSVISIFFFILAPIFLHRSGMHLSLMGQWIILFSFYIELNNSKSTPKKPKHKLTEGFANHDNDKAIFLNFVNDEDLPYLYKLSKLLVMPSYFGPTNIPPLEAFQLKVPVIYSDIPTFKKEFGDAVYYVDLNNSNSLAKAIKKIYENKELREELIKNGLDKIEQIKLYNSEEILFELFDNYFKVELRWK